jgi:NADPH:quinone reductase
MSSKLMRSLRFTEFGPPSVLRIEEGAIPEAGDGEALIQVKAAAINHSDTSQTSPDLSRTQLCREPPAGTLRAVVRKNVIR